MKTYQLHTLSWPQFQNFANIVIEHKYKVPVNSFRLLGKDGGRDGAATTTDNKKIVVQAKHTSDPTAKFKTDTLRKFEKEESGKIRSLVKDEMCHYYYAVTNFSVTADQNKKFINTVKKLGVEVADLIGKECLNRWIPGMPTKLLMNFPCLCSDEDELYSEKLKKRYEDESKTFKQTKSFTNAKTKLQEKNFVFLLGEEKNGKSSMMKQLALTSGNEKGTLMPTIQATDFKDKAKKDFYIFMVDDIFGDDMQIDENEIKTWNRIFKGDIISNSISISHNKIIMTSTNQIYKDAKSKLSKKFKKFLEDSHIDLSQDKELQDEIAKETSESPPSPDSNLEENKNSKENERSANKRKKGNQQSSSSPESNSKRGRSASTLSTKTYPTATKKGHVSIDLFSKDDASLSHSEALERIVNEGKQRKIKLKADKAAYKVTLCISQTGLKLNVSCPDLDSLESLWDDYLSGKLLQEVSTSFEQNGFSALNLGMYISPEEYLNCFHEFKAGELVPELSFHKLNKPNFAVLAISAVEDAYGIHLVAVHSEKISAVKSRVEKIELSGQVYRDQNVALTAVFALKDGIEIGDEELIDIFGFSDEKSEKLGANEEVHVYFVVTNYKVMRTQKEKLLRHYQAAGVKHAIIIDVNHFKILVYRSVTVQRVLLHLLIESLDIPDEEQTPIDITSANETPVSLNESEARRETASEASYPCKHSNKLPGAVLIDVQNPMHLRKRKSSFSLESNSKRSKRTSSSSTKASATETKKGHLSIELICKDATLLSHNEARQYKIKLETGLRKVAPNVKLDDISQTSLMLKLKVICPDLKCLDSLWEGYLSGKLLRQLSSGFVLNGFKCLNLGIFISPEEYLNCFHELKAGELVPELAFHNLNELNFAVLAISAVEDAYGIHLVAVHSEDISAVKSRVEKIELSGQVYRDQNVALTAVFVSKDGTEIGDEKLIDIFGFRDKKKQKRIANKEVHVYFVVTNYKLITTQQEKLLKHYQAAGIKHAIILDVNRLKILVYKFVTVQRVLLHLLIESLDIPDEGREVNQKLRKRTQKRTERRRTVGIRLQGSVPKKLKKRFKCPTKSVTNLVVRRGSHSPYKRTFKKEISSRKARKVSKTRKLPSYL